MIKKLLQEIVDGCYNPVYKFSEEFKNYFTPNYFKSAENNNWYYKLDELNVIVYDDSFNELVLEAIKKVKYFIGGSNGRNVYKSDFLKHGTYCYYQFEENKDYKKHILYLQHKYIIQLQTFKIELAKNTNEITKLKSIKSVGRDAMADINRRLRNDGTIKADGTLQDTLVGSAGNRLKYIFKLCIPNQIGYIKKTKVEQIVDHCYKADVSSAFPSQLQKNIPTTKYCKINKIKEPNEEYQFVFHYKKNCKYGSLKIYNELDTEIDLQSKFMEDVKYQMLRSETRTETLDKIDFDGDDIYIALKSAQITLSDVMQELYQAKSESATEEEKTRNKMVMNSFIGYCQLNKRPALAFISAVVIARQNHAMLERCKQLEAEGNQVLYIATDSIVWRGKSSLVATKDKFLGSFTQEYENCKFYGIQVGSYQIEENGKVKTYCSYLPNNNYKENLKIGELPKPKKENIIWQK